MALYAWQTLNLLQIFDVLRQASLCRLAVAGADGQPWCVPVRFQLEVRGSQTIIHLTTPEQGRKLTAAEENDHVCLEFELPGCAWLDTVILTGRVSVGIRIPGQAVEWRITAQELTGRRYFTVDEDA